MRLPAARIAAFVAAALTACPVLAFAFDLSRHTVAPSEIIRGGPKKDGIPAIDAPKFVPAGQAAFLTADSRVIGVARGGRAKAYPIRILNWHEVVNDEIGGLPIAVTYCPLTASAVVFDRRIGGRVTTFGVSGLLYQSNVLMYDRATESLWSQLAQQAVAGPLAGTRLRALPSSLTTWKQWRSRHPHTLVLSTDTGFARDYFRNPYASYEAWGETMFPVSRTDARLEAKALVLGVRAGGHERAYPLEDVRLAGGAVTDSLGGIRLRITAGRRTAEVTGEGKTLLATLAYWFAWAAFHPDTELWRFAMPEGSGPQATAKDIEIVELRDYWTSITGTLVLQPEADPFSRGGIYVVAGKIRNNSGRPVHHVRLRFELVDAQGRTVYSEEGYNRAAEAMIELDRPGQQPTAEMKAIVPIPPGGTDTFRMIFIGEELPRFERPRVTVIATGSLDWLAGKH